MEFFLDFEFRTKSEDQESRNSGRSQHFIYSGLVGFDTEDRFKDPVGFHSRICGLLDRGYKRGPAARNRGAFHLMSVRTLIPVDWHHVARSGDETRVPTQQTGGPDQRPTISPEFGGFVGKENGGVGSGFSVEMRYDVIDL